ncbi:LamG-like jellyroll fold domain-containing protein [Streptomyces sp. WI04-05B]|uniref:LamG-like jellyroll fold domain-containing protein n=1 Tax=Streptomyces TaxID=1883 RepID=UPI0029BCC312|nr:MULTISPECIES: LamG-like jellyroll fold domain-containing protein [unclassified Streptomyces]MDX2545286.1 exo-alpha-sialidase [Streptomyces sp. WI04-05B]MDX2588219.1 exo-alpha-sialidase [Streptomyces sp. WI04-05A]
MKTTSGSTAEPAARPAPAAPRRGRPRWRSTLLSFGLALGLAGGLGVAPQAVAAGVANSSKAQSIGNTPQQILFQAGTGGYGCYRIPALVRTGDGSLLAFAEGRKTQSCGDRGDNDIVVRRSTNDGRTWGPIKVVAAGNTAPGAYGTGTVPAGTEAGSPVTRTNPAPVVDAVNHRVYLLSTSNPVNNSIPRIPWVQQSADDGLTWSAPTALNVSLTTSPVGGGWFATGPGHGVQLTQGTHKNRLVVGAHQHSGSSVHAGYLYLDPNANNTAQWKASSTVGSTLASVKPAEVSATEVAGGKVLLAARNEDVAGNHRLTNTSDTPTDDTVPAVGEFKEESIPAPADIQGSVLTVQQADASKNLNEEVLLSAPANVPAKTEMTIWSRCAGVWNSTGKVVSAAPDKAGYSDLALMADNEIGLLYEAGVNYSANEIRFTRFSQGQLDTGCNASPPASTSNQASPALAPTTPDASPQANDGYLSSTGATLSGTDPLRNAGDTTRNNSNLALTAGGYAEVPYARSLRTGTGDFTYSMWFKYQAQTDPATEPDHILFWSGATGTAEPQVWLRTQRKNNLNQLYAWAQSSGTDQARATLKDTSDCACAFGDNAWHFVTVTRAGSRLSVQVDSGPVGVPTGAITGDVSSDPTGSPLGIRIGARPVDASSPFTGKIDEFRLYRSALTSAQRASLATADTSRDKVSGSTDPAADTAANAGLAVRLPFQAMDQTTAVSTTNIGGTDDESGNCTDGTLLGAKAVTGGRFSDALPVRSALPGVTSELTPALDVADRDFTYAMWFRFFGSASGTGQRALLWAYGPNKATSAQLWVQAIYDKDNEKTSLLAAVQSDTGPAVTVRTNANGQNFGDGNWHMFTLQRHGSAVQLDVWGVATDDAPVLQESATASAALSGSLTAARASGITGVRVGSKPDGTKILDGDLDDFRLYDHALNAGESKAVAGGGGLYPTSGLSVRWSFDNKYMYSIPANRAAPETTPATPDHSGWCNNAYVLNGGSIDTVGKLGTGLRLDGSTGAAALVPYSPSLALAPEAVAPSTQPSRQGETSDFTLSLWFRYDTTVLRKDQVLLWAYGAGSAERQVWLRAGADGISADVETGASGARLLAKDPDPNRVAFWDDNWHHVTLVRSGDSLTLAVDNSVSQATADLGDGALTATDTFAVDGFRLGSKPDGSQPLTGSLDEVRIYRQALSATDLGILQDSPAGPPAPTPVLWLPFDTITARSYSRM